jgi:hypothetical protein
MATGGFLAGCWFIHKEHPLELLGQKNGFPFSSTEFPG